MDAEMTPHVALSVPDMDEAAAYYERVFDWRQTRREKDWIEMRSGPLHLYLCEDSDPSPTFATEVEDLQVALQRFLCDGCTLVRQTEGEAYVKDRYGHHFCVSPRQR